MASGPSSIIEELVCCHVCFDNFREPRALPCLHAYCTACLQGMVTDQEKLRCPECRMEYEVPGKDVTKFVSDFRIDHIYKMAQNDPRNADPRCRKHPGRTCELYCDGCSEMMCYKCVAKGESCHFHAYKDSEEKVEEARQHLTSVVRARSVIVNTIMEILSCLKNMEEKQVEDYDVLCATIKIRFEGIAKDTRGALADKKNSLLKEAQNAHEKILQVLRDERGNVEVKRSEVMEEKRLCEEILAMPTSENSAVPAFMAQYEDFKRSQLPEFTLPDISMKMAFEDNCRQIRILVEDAIKNYGQVRNGGADDDDGDDDGRNDNAEVNQLCVLASGLFLDDTCN